MKNLAVLELRFESAGLTRYTVEGGKAVPVVHREISFQAGKGNDAIEQALGDLNPKTRIAVIVDSPFVVMKRAILPKGGESDRRDFIQLKGRQFAGAHRWTYQIQGNGVQFAVFRAEIAEAIEENCKAKGLVLQVLAPAAAVALDSIDGKGTKAWCEQERVYFSDPDLGIRSLQGGLKSLAAELQMIGKTVVIHTNDHLEDGFPAEKKQPLPKSPEHGSRIAFALGKRCIEQNSAPLNLYGKSPSKGLFPIVEPFQSLKFSGITAGILLTLLILSGWAASAIEASQYTQAQLVQANAKSDPVAIRENLSILQDLKEERIPLYDLLLALNECKPQGLKILEFDLSEKGAGVLAGETGSLASVEEFVTQLNDSRFFRSASTQSTDREDRKVTFRIAMEVRVN